jgi:adenylosuccinate lyase
MAELFDAIARANTILIDPTATSGLHLAGLLQAETLKAGEDRLLDHAAQGQSDRLRELRRQPRPGQRGAAPPGRKAADLALQRDLTDSTVLRNMGVAFGYTLLAYDSTLLRA